MTKNVKIAVALLGGYVLGRTKKAKMALGLGMFLAGKKIDLDPRNIGKLLANSPALGGLNQQVRSELVDATRSAATEALTQRAAGLASSLAKRTQALGATDEARAEEPDGPDEPDEPAEDGGDEKPARRRSSAGESTKDGGRAPAKRTRSAAEGAARRTSQATRKRTGAAKSAASKQTGTARKRTSSARKSGGEGNG
ncbi:hypothetical protein ACFZCP_29910 [Streptomyces sp. NPDC007971]|uniref:hypothetical protein n=1 Tax=Streptomyces sp. NPDC007971 TaxID=3364799 RepID=UPI0036E8B150